MLVNNRILEPASAMRTVESETVAGVSRTTVVTEAVYAIINTVKAHIQDVHPERYVTIPKDEFMRLSKWTSEEDVVRDDTDSYTITYDIFKRAVIYQLTALGYDTSLHKTICRTTLRSYISLGCYLKTLWNSNR